MPSPPHASRPPGRHPLAALAPLPLAAANLEECVGNVMESIACAGDDHGSGGDAHADALSVVEVNAVWHRYENPWASGCETAVGYAVAGQGGLVDEGCPLGPPPNPGWGSLTP